VQQQGPSNFAFRQETCSSAMSLQRKCATEMRCVALITENSRSTFGNPPSGSTRIEPYICNIEASAGLHSGAPETPPLIPARGALFLKVFFTDVEKVIFGLGYQY